MPVVWYRNSRTDPRVPDQRDVLLPPAIRAILVGVGAVQFALAVVLLVLPDTMTAFWPWSVTPLTAQVVGGWFALPGVVALLMAIDHRWSASRITLQSQLIGLALILIGVVRAWGNFDQLNPLTWIFIGAIAALFASLLALHVAMERRRAAAAVRPHGPVMASAD